MTSEASLEPIDVYWSFRSPYSYLATPDMVALARDYWVEVNLRVVLPIAIREPGLLFSEDKRKHLLYVVMDWERRAEMLGMPHRWPSPDPVVQDVGAGSVPKEQPYIHRLSRLGVEAQRRGAGVPFAAEVSRLIFGGTANWDEGDKLARAVSRAGLDLAELDAAITTEGADHAAEIECNQRALDTAGGWGVPTAVLRDEIFFGQDRMDTLRWRLEQLGLSRR